MKLPRTLMLIYVSQYIPGRLNMSNNPDNPASLLEPYNCDATAGLRDRKQPQTKPYMMPNAIYGCERMESEGKEHAGQKYDAKIEDLGRTMPA